MARAFTASRAGATARSRRSAVDVRGLSRLCGPGFQVRGRGDGALRARAFRAICRCALQVAARGCRLGPALARHVPSNGTLGVSGRRGLHVEDRRAA